MVDRAIRSHFAKQPQSDDVQSVVVGASTGREMRRKSRQKKMKGKARRICWKCPRIVAPKHVSFSSSLRRRPRVITIGIRRRTGSAK
jgi:hypothetical protein